MSRDILAYPLPPPVAFGDTFPYPSHAPECPVLFECPLKSPVIFG